MYSRVITNAKPGSMAQKCVAPSSARPGFLNQKRTHLIEVADDDEIVVKWNEDGSILTNLEPKVRDRALRQAEDLLGELELCGLPSNETTERAMEPESSISSSSNAGEDNQVTKGCNALQSPGGSPENAKTNSGCDAGIQGESPKNQRSRNGEDAAQGEIPGSVSSGSDSKHKVNALQSPGGSPKNAKTNSGCDAVIPGESPKNQRSRKG